MTIQKELSSSKRNVLPEGVCPVHYEITLQPSLSPKTHFSVEGRVVIGIAVTKPGTRTITLNTKDLAIGKCTLLISKDADIAEAPLSIQPLSVTVDDTTERLHLEFGQELPVCGGPNTPSTTLVELEIEFSGHLHDKMCGFYRSAYHASDAAELRYIAVTQFEATDARRAFPCWDEPSQKATFDIVLVVPPELTALSNMPVLRTEQVSGQSLQRVVFARTPIMSTYLIAFVVGELDYVEAYTSGKQPVRCRVYALPGQAEHGRLALGVATRVLDLYAQLFGSAYPLPKLDMVAVPDFEAGAMENWGLVTYRTVLLLHDPSNSTARSRQHIASVVAHELAHQWFGNLVTMEWWEHLWLNEGFATWVSWLALDRLYPQWKVWPQFVVDELQRGLQLDGLRCSHPIEVEVCDPAEIHQIFDAISYSKGASVIRMLSSFLGEEKFLKGVSMYLARHAYGNASTTDLWHALGEASGLDVASFMSGWTRQVGYPLVAVQEVEGGLHLQQRRFLVDGSAGADSASPQPWWIPVRLVSVGSDAVSSDVLTHIEGSVPRPAGDAAYKLNSEQTGIYRVSYPWSALLKLGDAISCGKLTREADRIGIIGDVAALAQSGHGRSSHLLQLIVNFTNESEYVVWNEIARCLQELRSVWFEQPRPVMNKLRQLQCQLFAPLTHKLGWEAECVANAPGSDEEEGSMLREMLRSLAIAKAGAAGDKDILEEAKRRFRQFVSSPKDSEGLDKILHPNLRGVVFGLVVQEGDLEEYEAVQCLYQESTVPDQKLNALSALGATRKPELIRRSLEYAISEHVRPQDIIYLFASLAANFHARYALWEFVKEQWCSLYERYKFSLSILGSIVRAGVAGFSSSQMLEDVERFFSDKDTSQFSRPLQQSLERLTVSAAWLERDRDDVANWLDNYSVATKTRFE